MPRDIYIADIVTAQTGINSGFYFHYVSPAPGCSCWWSIVNGIGHKRHTALSRLHQFNTCNISKIIQYNKFFRSNATCG